MKKYSVIILLVGVLAACVTINIYFPAAAAQEVADEIIDDVWQINDDADAKASETKISNPVEPLESQSQE